MSWTYTPTNLKIYNLEKYKERMSKTLLKIAGTIILSLNSLNTNKYVPVINLNQETTEVKYDIAKRLSNKELINPNQETSDINKIILINARLEYYSRVLREEDSSSYIFKKYKQDSISEAKELEEYKRRRFSD